MTDPVFRHFPPPTGVRAARSLLRNCLLGAMRAGQLLVPGFLDARMAMPRVQFLYLHHVFSDEEDRLRALLRKLGRQATFISYSQAIDLAKTGGADRPYVAFSFDDGLRNCLSGARILEEFGISACYFVCPEVVDRSEDRPYLSRWCQNALNMREPTEVLGWNDLEGLLARGHEVGSHTLTHVELSSIDIDEAKREIAESRSRLVDRLGSRAGGHFAWPYGELRHITDGLVDFVYSIGHVSCASAVRGAHLRGCRPRQAWIHRDQVRLDWPMFLTETFMARNARDTSAEIR